MILEVLIFITLILFLVYIKSTKPSDLSPGSFGFPVIGSLPPVNVPITEHLRILKKKYGNIFTTKWGSRTVVVLADYRLIKKALNHPDFQGRMQYYSIGVFNHFLNVGVLFSSNDSWKNNRRFLLRNLRDLGMGKSRMESSIQDEAEMLVKYLEQNSLDKPAEIDWTINIAVLNVIWEMLANKRYKADDEHITKYSKIIYDNMQITQGRMFILDVMPWLVKLCPKVVIDNYFRSERLTKNCASLHSMFMDTIRQHETDLDRDNPRDIVDQYLIEMELQKHDPNTTFRSDYLDLLAVMGNMFTAGSETTANSIRWCILYMALYPEIQEKAQRTLDEVVPTNRLPSLDDKDKLPYIEALILDTLRLSSLLPNSLPHRATATVNFEGYTIPEGTMILPCLELCHRDPDLWEKPDVLHPEHFLDENGRLDAMRDGFMPFSNGRRQCLGEPLARMELFLFISALLQRFSFSAPPGVTLEAESDPTKKVLNHPKPFKVVLKKRI